MTEQNAINIIIGALFTGVKERWTSRETTDWIYDPRQYARVIGEHARHR